MSFLTCVCGRLGKERTPQIMTARRTKLGQEWRVVWQSSDFQAALRDGIARMRDGDEWPLGTIVSARIWKGLHADPVERGKVRRCIGRTFQLHWRAGKYLSIEPVPGSRRPTLWRRSQSVRA